MRAAREFAAGLDADGMLEVASGVRAELYGSLALTGMGHGTDRALLLGLAGETPDTVDPQRSVAGPVLLLGRQKIEYNLVFHRDLVLPGHPNAMRFTAYQGERVLRSALYYSTGGGFVVRDGVRTGASAKAPVPYPFQSADELLRMPLPVWEVMLENEKAWRPEAEIRSYIARVWAVMEACVERGLTTSGLLPGGLDVARRAPGLRARLLRDAPDPLAVIDWVNVWAIAVNEENAAGGRVVTAPTNGAAGIVPAVAHYYQRFVAGADDAGIQRFFLTAAAIGVLYKENASISGAEVGCQGEVGVACSMAAAGLVAAQSGGNAEIEHAAEIAMEHNLGMTCDPIGGLVQIPCIERNAVGAVKAINAARLSMHGVAGHKVSLDQVIRTMYQTGLDMQSRYKETSQAGLAVNVVEC